MGPLLLIDNDPGQRYVANIMRAITASTLLEAIPADMLALLAQLSPIPEPKAPTLRFVA